MEQFQIKDKRRHLVINNSPIKLGIDIVKVLSALNIHPNGYRKMHCFDYTAVDYFPRGIYLFGSMNNLYIIIVIKCCHITRNAGDIIVKESFTSMLAVFRVDMLDKSKTVIIDISPHGFMARLTSRYNICGCIYSTGECINVLRGKDRCCDSPDIKKTELFRDIHRHTSIVPGTGCSPKLKFPLIKSPYIQHDITHITDSIIELKDDSANKWLLNYKTLTVLDAETWFEYKHLLKSSGLPPELESSILNYC